MGPNVLGFGPHNGTSTIKPRFDGATGGKHTGKPDTHVSEQSGTTSSLAGEDESTDQEDAIPPGYKTDVLGLSSNRHWKGHFRGHLEKIHPLYQRKRCCYSREGSAIPGKIREEPEDQERRDLRDGVTEKEVFRNLSEISPTNAKRIQVSKIQTPEEL